MKIKVYNPSELPTTDYRTVQPLQGPLKEMSITDEAKLEASFKKYGCRFSIKIWFDNGGAAWTIDGHGRLKWMEKNDVTDEKGEFDFLPYEEIYAKSKREAAELILVNSSTYQKTTNEGLEFFLAEFEIEDFEEYTTFEAEAGEGPQGNFNDDGIEGKNQYGVIVKCIDAIEQEKVFNFLIGRGYDCKVVVT